MKYTFKLVIISCFLGLGMQSKTQAQDAQISQYDMAPILFNPANTGMMKYSDFRISALYRNQWSSLASSFSTFALSFDMVSRDRWGFGAAMINSDQANIISSFNFVGSVAYQISNPRQQKYSLSAGLQLGFIYKRVNSKDLIFDNQYDGSNFDSDLPTGEAFVRNSRFMPDVNFGISYKGTDRTKKLNLYGDGAVFHVTAPNESFIGEQASKLPLRWMAGIGAKYEINRMFILDPSVVYMRQRQAQQFLATVMGDYEVQGTPYHLLVGLGYRTQDAGIVHAGIKHDANIFRISYDFNTSELSSYSNNRGALEFTVIYRPGRRTSRAIY